MRRLHARQGIPPEFILLDEPLEPLLQGPVEEGHDGRLDPVGLVGKERLDGGSLGEDEVAGATKWAIATGSRR
jgi:hypothetical protein